MKIAILGGGVAGIASAIAFKLKGFDVTVHERRDADSNIGAGIVAWPNAFVLDQFGMLGCAATLLARTITHPHLTPWLSTVVVPPAFRGRGIASALSLHIACEAASGSRRLPVHPT